MPTPQEFRQYMLEKYPNMDQKQIGKLDEFSQRQTIVGLVESGQINAKDLGVSGVKEIAPYVDPKALRPKLTGSSASDSLLLTNILDAVQNVNSKENLNKSSGPLDTLMNTGKILFNMPGAGEEATLRQDVGDIRTAIRNYISGAAVSDAEAEEFKNLIPRLIQSDSQFQSVIDGLDKKSKQKIENLLYSQGLNISADDYLSGRKRSTTTNTGGSSGLKYLGTE